jgi:hypothetical protein
MTFLFILFSFVAVCPVKAGTVPTLEDAVRDAKAILVGEVVGVEEVAYQEGERGQRVTVAVREVLKGYAAASGVAVNFRPSPDTPAEFRPGERCMLFISTWEGEYRVFEAPGGKILFEEGMDMPGHIRTDDFQQFLKDVSELLQRSPAHR